MINTKLTKKAMIIAYNAHMDQIDKGGVPYIYHPIHLAEQMDTEIECIVALLHDVVEDTSITFEQLQQEFSSEIIDVLRLLTHNKDIKYINYIKNIKENDVAKKVKVADLKHNLDTSRLEVITKMDLDRIGKYKEALEFLED